MIIDTQQGRYRIVKHRSIYTNRGDELDVYVQRENAWGGKAEDGRYYTAVAIYAAESGELIKGGEPLPDQVKRQIDAFL